MQLILVFVVIALMLLVMGIVIRYKQIMEQVNAIKPIPKTENPIPPPKVLVVEQSLLGQKRQGGANRSVRDNEKEQ
jgi:hypothetical protein